METLHHWLLEINGASAIPGLLFFFFRRDKKTNSVFFIIFSVLFLSFLADNINYFFIRLVFPNSYIINNIWLIFNYFLMLWLFKKILPSSINILKLLSVVFACAAVVSFWIYSFLEPNTVLYLISDLSFVFLSLITYYELLRNPSGQLKSQPIFWMVTSFFVFHSIILLQSIFDNYLIFDQEISKTAYRIIHIINLLANTTKNFILFYTLILIDKGHPDTIKPVKTK